MCRNISWNEYALAGTFKQVALSPATASAAGLVFGLSLIVSVGAQNLYVFKQGMTRIHVPTVVVVCGISDVVLIAAGVTGAGSIIGDRHSLLEAVRVAGAMFLFAYAALAARRAVGAASASAGTVGVEGFPSWTTVLATCLAFTWLNPAVYLDTVVLIGSVANSAPGRQWWFAAGAAGGSVAWFAGLGFGARILTPLFAQRRAWRWLDVFNAIAMTAIGVRVLFWG
jgi:L-lysine exporter family protein LysE/ArgO